MEKLSADCDHYREMVTSREKAMKVSRQLSAISCGSSVIKDGAS